VLALELTNQCHDVSIAWPKRSRAPAQRVADHLGERYIVLLQQLDIGKIREVFEGSSTS
jgi:hypothetical protein